MTLRPLVSSLLFALALPLSASVVTGEKAAASTPSPIATRVAMNTMRDGGSAIDAAIAAQLVMSVTQPQNTGLGGGGFLLYYEKKSGAVWALDFREVSPRELPKKNAPPAASRTIGIPGVVAGLAAAHERFGVLKWSLLFEPAVLLAAGTSVDAAVAAELGAAAQERAVGKDDGKKNAWFAEGHPLQAGSPIVQEALGRTLQRIAERGAADFYDGATARQLVTELRAAGSTVSLRDLRDYKALWRAPIRVDYAEQQLYIVPPPSRGGFIIASALGVLRPFELQKAFDAPTIHLLAEALRRAEADARSSVGDPARVRAPYAELLSTAHLDAVAASIDRTKAVASSTLLAVEESRQNIRSSDVVTVDEAGNVACLSTTLGAAFGSGVFSNAGFFLNDALSDFEPTGLVNVIEGSRRPASPLTPMIFLHNGAPVAAVGASAGASTASVLLQLAVDSAYFGTDLAQAIDVPRFRQSLQPDELQYERLDEALLQQLAAMGHAYKEKLAIGAVQAIVIDGAKLRAISDRRSGGAAGAY
jgi:gamma-glutamyltranspeptidase/glutathione hydrolase